MTRELQCVHFGLSHPPKDLDSLHVVLYSHASFVTNEDAFSQLGFIILLVEGSCKACILSFARRNSKRIVRLVVGDAFFTFPEAEDKTPLIPHGLRIILKKEVRPKGLTDTSLLFSMIIR